MRFFTISAAVLLALALGITAAWISKPKNCSAMENRGLFGYCSPTQCISSAGCIPPCMCAKQQGEAYGVCVSTNHE